MRIKKLCDSLLPFSALCHRVKRADTVDCAVEKLESSTIAYKMRIKNTLRAEQFQ